MSTSDSKTIKVDYLARVEGEGAMKVVVRDGKIAVQTGIVFGAEE